MTPKQMMAGKKKKRNNYKREDKGTWDKCNRNVPTIKFPKV